MINSLSPYQSGYYIPGVNPVSFIPDSNKSKASSTAFADIYEDKKDLKNDKENVNDAQKSQSRSVTNKNNELSDEDKKILDNLKQIEQRVRTHEQAHISAGGGLVRGGASYSYQMGPDGKRYIVGGEVKIDAAPVPDDPQATILKMQQVRAAALAPSDPSAQDRAVANEASKNESNARIELSKMKLSEYSDKKVKSAEFIDLIA